MVKRRKTAVLLSCLLGLALLLEAGGCAEDRRRGGGGGGGGGGEGGGEADAGPDTDRCLLADAPAGRQVGNLVQERVAFENDEGQRLAVRDFCGDVIWVQVGSEDT